MKSLITLLFVVFLAGMTSAQHTLKTAVKETRLPALDKKLHDYTIFTMDTRQLTNLKKNTTNQFSISLDKNHSWDLVLEPNDLRAPSYQAVRVTDEGEKTWDYEVTTYKGYSNRNTENQVRLTIEDEHISGYIQDGDDMFFVEPIKDILKSNTSKDFVLYRATDVTNPGITCAASKFEDGVKVVENEAQYKSNASNGCMALELAIEADYDYYTIHGAETANTILGILNQVEGVYDSQIDLDIQVTFQRIFETANDPYTDTINTAGYILSEFRNHWNMNMGHIERDLAHLWTGRSTGGIAIGMAYTNAACSSPTYTYSFSQNIGSFAASRQVLTAHEIGHNLGGQHSHGESCSGSGSIMCSGVQPGSFYFSDAAIQTITAKLNSSAQCFIARPSKLEAEVSCTDVKLTWAGSSDNGFDVRVRPVGDTNWASYTSTSNFLQLAGLTASEYEFQVKQTCNSVDSGFSPSTTFSPEQTLDLQLTVFLEGAYDKDTDKMRTSLNDLKILPGQADSDRSRQPYNVAPWNYYGTEGLNWKGTDYQKIEAENGNKKVVDWILVSFRTSPIPTDEIKRAAALLLEDGSVVFPDENVFPAYAATDVYIVIEHRNHMGVMTPQIAQVNSCTLSYDFSSKDSYVDATGIGFGQKTDTGRWVMYAGDGSQGTDGMSYDITGSDKAIWAIENGFSRLYSDADFNLDGDITGADKALWAPNNGKSSRVEKSY